MPKIPLPMRDPDVFDLSGIETDVWLTTNLSYDAVINDGNVIDHLSVAQRDSRNVIAHASKAASIYDIFASARKLIFRLVRLTDGNLLLVK